MTSHADAGRGLAPASVWWTVGLTALAAPMGSVVAALALGQVVAPSSGGMEDLAAFVVGLWLGAPLVALLVFAVCVFTLLRDVPMRRWFALGVMLGFVVLEALVMLVGLRFVGSGAAEEVGLVVVGVLCTLVIGVGAFIAIRWART